MRRPEFRQGEHGVLPVRNPRPWVSLGTSALLHGLLIVAALLLSQREARDLARDRVNEPPREPPLYIPLPPPPPPAPEPPPPPQPPPPERQPEPPLLPPRVEVPPPTVRQAEPEPEPNAPPDARRTTGAEPEDERDRGDERDAPPNPAAAPKPPADVSTAPTMESEARRIFGRLREGPPPGAGPRDIRPLETELPDRPDKCVPKPSPPRDSAGPPQYGVAVGRIFRADNGAPLAGAHLQMLGTPFATFTDATGQYRFRFDLSLIDNCRQQFVRVTAPGYRSELLVLRVGANVRSEDVYLKKR